MYKSSKIAMISAFLVGTTLAMPAYGGPGRATIKSDFWSCGLTSGNDQLSHLGITYSRAWVFDYEEITDNFNPKNSKVVLGWKVELGGKILGNVVRLHSTQEVLPEYLEDSELGYFEYIDVLFNLKGYNGRAMDHEDFNGLVDVAMEHEFSETYPNGDSSYSWTWNIKGQIPGYDNGILKLSTEKEFGRSATGTLTLAKGSDVNTIPVVMNCSYSK